MKNEISEQTAQLLLKSLEEFVENMNESNSTFYNTAISIIKMQRLKIIERINHYTFKSISGFRLFRKYYTKKLEYYKTLLLKLNEILSDYEKESSNQD